MYFDSNERFIMREDELVFILSKAFSRMLDIDKVLFDVAQPQERAFMHRFALHLHVVLSSLYPLAFVPMVGKPALSLDVEYNRDGTAVKGEDGPKDPNTHKWVAPDIILHERLSGSLEGADCYRNDIFACEMKKDASPDGKDAERVKSFMRTRKYMFGIDFYQFAFRPYCLDLFYANAPKKSFSFDEMLRVFVQSTE